MRADEPGRAGDEDSHGALWYTVRAGRQPEREQKFDVPLPARDRRDRVGADREAERAGRGAHLGQRPARAASSRTIPPLPMSARPTSNCGLTSATPAPPAGERRQRRQHQPQRDERHVDDDQVDARGEQIGRRASGCSSRSMTRTRGSDATFQSSWPCPTSTQ